MAYRKRRRKISNQEFGIGLAALFVFGLLNNGGSSASNSAAEILIPFLVVIAIIGGAYFWFISHIQEKQRQALRLLGEDNIDSMTGVEFEKYVGAMLAGQGYKSIKYTKASNDDGVDITAVMDGRRYVIQAKRYAGKVGKTHIFPITSARQTLGYDEAMVVTNNYFTKDAIDYAKRSRCVLVDRDVLGRWRNLM